MIEFTQDRRQHPRLSQNVAIKIFQDEGDIVTETSNISGTGIYCKVNKYLRPMTKLKIRLLLPLRKNNKKTTKQISCHAVIVRAEPADSKGSYYAAIFFNDMTPKDAGIISDYVNSCLEQNVNLS